MLTQHFDRVKKLADRIRELEDKLMNTALLPLADQQKIHAEIRKYKDEMALLEKRTR